MQINYKRITYILTAVLALTLLFTISVLAGNVDSPSGPTEAGSQMYTLEDIYQRLAAGTAGSKMTTFTEPLGGPGTGSMHTLDEIYEELKSTNSRVPKTGQTACYDSSGTTITCTGTGQDGEYELGVSPPLAPNLGTAGVYTVYGWEGVRFTDNGDGTVSDNLTGLIWLKAANCIQSKYPGFDTDGTAGDGRVTWQHGLDFVAGINAGTYGNCGADQTDWRLPNVNELHSLIDLTQTNPALPLGHPFSAVQTNYYWSSTSNETYPYYAWFVYLSNGSVFSDLKIYAYYVWPVRAG